ncbi:MAG: M24 family metallopeptidase [Acidimicrobiales bacterium]
MTSSLGPVAPMDVSGRLGRLREELSERGLHAVVVTNPANVRYLSGFSGSAGVVTVTAERALLATDGRYRTQSAEELAGAGAAERFELAIGGGDAQRKAICALLGVGSSLQVAFEAEHLSWAASRRWRDHLPQGCTGVPVTGLVEELREVKDEGELARMERAAAIADSALQEVLPMLAGSSGVTEQGFALELDTAMRRHGASDRAFDTIVAVGAHSAKPHHQPTAAPIEPGEPLVVDFGATYDGYRSDMTRTFFVGGEPTGEMARVLAVVAASQAMGVAKVAPGVAAKDVDGVCREVIADAGWSERFEHGTGHGVGLDVHEAPTVSQLGTAILGPGVVVTVEPGVYLPGIGGVRIEDTLVVTQDSNRALTRFPKDVVV